MRLVSALLSAVLFAISLPGPGLAPLAWIALVPLLLALRGARVGTALLQGAIFGFFSTLLVIEWIPGAVAENFHGSSSGGVILWVGIALLAVPASSLWALAASRFDSRNPFYPLAAGALWGLVEVWHGYGFPKAPWIVLGASQIDTVVTPLAACVGVHGVSALLVASAGVVTQVLSRVPWASLVVSIALTTGFSSIGIWAGLPTPTEGKTNIARIGIVQPSVPMSHRYGGYFDVRNLEALIEETRKLADVDLVVWPEAAFTHTLAGRPRRREHIQAFVDELGVPVLAGGTRLVPDRSRRTSAFLFVPHGDVQPVYDKRRLLPLAESVPGWVTPRMRRALGRMVPSLPVSDGEQPFEVPSILHDYELLICYEAIFSDLPQNPHTTVLLNLVNDGWYDRTAGARQHLLLARWRAVETGAYLLRAASTGISAVISQDGSILQKLDVHERAGLRAELLLRSRETPFEDWGVPWLTTLLIGLLFTYLSSQLLPSSRARASERPTRIDSSRSD